MANELKIYEFAEVDYVVAYNLRQAVRCYTATSSYGVREAIESHRVLKNSEWTKYRFFYDGEGKKSVSFKKRIKEILDNKEERVPFFFCSSEW